MDKESGANEDRKNLAEPCVHEFLAIVTHPRIYVLPTPLDAAIDQVEA